MNHPNPPIAVDIETQWHAKHQRASRATRIRSGPGYRISRGTGSVGIDPNRKGNNPLNLHPFKIYQFPRALRKFTNFDPDEGPRFKVRDARVTILGTTGINGVSGSDGLTNAGNYENLYSKSYGLGDGIQTQILPDDDSQTDTNGLFSNWNEIAIPADARTYYFWYSFVLPVSGGSWGGISINTLSHGLAVCPSDDPTDAKVMLTLESFDSTLMWPGMPYSDHYNFYVGSVTVDDGTIAEAFPGFPKVVISQDRAEDLDLPGHPYGTAYAGQGSGTEVSIEMRFRGSYSAIDKYFVGDVVLITYADSTGVNSAYQYIYDPPSASAYLPYKIPGPLIGVSPNGSSPDPWRLLSKSPSAADYHNGAYDASKFYLRTA